MRVWIYISALDACEWSALRFAVFIPGKEIPVHIWWRFGWTSRADV